jgi:hypothetical protein
VHESGPGTSRRCASVGYTIAAMRRARRDAIDPNVWTSGALQEKSVSRSNSLRWWAPTQASMPMRQGGRLASLASSWRRESFWRKTMAPRLLRQVEGILADVDAENGDGVLGVVRHGGLLVSAPRSTLAYCGEHRRSIPLGNLARQVA